MALQRLTADDFEFFTLETNPKRTYVSSSAGITGSVNLFARRSPVEKEVLPLSAFSQSFFRDENVDDIRKLAVFNTSSNIKGDVEAYMAVVQEQQQSARKQQKLEIYRFVPPFRLNSNFLRKSLTREILMPYYRPVYPRGHYNVANYNVMNFFTASNVPEDSVLLYPNPVATDGSGSNYQISGAFSFDFYIKPKYTTVDENAAYKPGAILHLSNSYCLSLHTGSSRDLEGRPNRFKIGVQLGVDATTTPSNASAGPLTFFSSENALSIDGWNHVTITWGGPNYNNGSGSIRINDRFDSSFVITESLFLGHYTGSTDPSVLCVGNYYEGGNNLFSSMDRFFAADTAEREGLLELNGTGGVFEPDAYQFTHPLNAEIHEIKLYDKYLTTSASIALSSSGPTDLNNLRLYIPPFFTYESPFRKNVGTTGGELVTPFFAKDASTNTPFAAQMAFSCGGFYMNLENYVRDFATGNYPRLWNLTGSVTSPPSTTILSANDFLYATGSNIKRLYQILPSDNGRFNPNYDMLSALTQSRFVNDLGNSEPGAVSLNNIVSDTFDSRAVKTSGSILNDILGARPEDISTLPGNSLAILHRTEDSSSNQVVIFDISNMFYGLRIKPGTLTLQDTQLNFADFGMTIKDDGRGNLYRAEASGEHPTWASVGNVFYDEGIVIIKAPQFYFFGLNQFELNFEGEQNLHVLTINSFARPVMQTSSSNPSFRSQPSSTNANETDEKFVYITAVNVHDENLNVIARAKLAQPIVKRSGDKMLFKVKLDY